MVAPAPPGPRRAEPDARGVGQPVQVEGQAVGDVDHGVRAAQPGHLALHEARHAGAGRRPPRCTLPPGPQGAQPGRRTAAGARHQQHVVRPGAGSPHGDRRPRPSTVPSTVTATASTPDSETSPPTTGHAGHGRGLGHAGHDPQRQLTLARATRDAQRHQRRQRRRTHGGQVAQGAHERLPAHVGRAAERQVEVHALDDAVDRRQQGPPAGRRSTAASSRSPKASIPFSSMLRIRCNTSSSWTGAVMCRGLGDPTSHA